MVQFEPTVQSLLVPPSQVGDAASDVAHMSGSAASGAARAPLSASRRRHLMDAALDAMARRCVVRVVLLSKARSTARITPVIPSPFNLRQRLPQPIDPRRPRIEASAHKMHGMMYAVQRADDRDEVSL